LVLAASLVAGVCLAVSTDGGGGTAVVIDDDIVDLFVKVSELEEISRRDDEKLCKPYDYGPVVRARLSIDNVWYSDYLDEEVDVQTCFSENRTLAIPRD